VSSLVIDRPDAGFTLTVPSTWCELAPGRPGEETLTSGPGGSFQWVSVFRYRSCDAAGGVAAIKALFHEVGLPEPSESDAAAGVRRLTTERRAGPRTLAVVADVIATDDDAVVLLEYAPDGVPVGGSAADLTLIPVDDEREAPPWVTPNHGHGTRQSPSSRRLEIVLIGPVAAGKSTIGHLVARQLGTALVDLDAAAQRYYADVGAGPRELASRMQADGVIAGFRWWENALAYSVERATVEYSDCPIAFGAGHSHYENRAMFDRAAQALGAFENVVLLLPSPDPERSIQLLREASIRERGNAWRVGDYDFIDAWVNSPCNRALAKHIVHTEGCTPEETAEAVLGAVGLP
jgi:hypothetical protein